MPARFSARRTARWISSAASFAATMTRYAVTGRGYGVVNGARAMRALAREVASAVNSASGTCECPICGWSGPAFGPAYYVDWYREGVRCWACNSTDRCRLAKLYVERSLGAWFAERRRRVLDVGPVAYSRCFFPEDVDYTSFDLVSPVASVNGDLCSAPFSDGAFDLWMCFHVLDLIPDDQSAMRELWRMLAPGGVGLLDNAMDWSKPTTEYGEARPEECTHRRRYGHDLPDRLRALGFDVELVRAEEVLDDATRSRAGVMPRTLVVCRKPHQGPLTSRAAKART